MKILLNGLKKLIIFLAVTGTVDMVKGFEASGVDYITKSFPEKKNSCFIKHRMAGYIETGMEGR